MVTCLSCAMQVRIMLSVLQFRLNRRYVEANPPFVTIELDQSDSGREGCAVSTLTITSEPKDWRGAVQVWPCTSAACLSNWCANYASCATLTVAACRLAVHVSKVHAHNNHTITQDDRMALALHASIKRMTCTNLQAMTLKC